MGRSELRGREGLRRGVAPRAPIASPDRPEPGCPGREQLSHQPGAPGLPQDRPRIASTGVVGCASVRSAAVILAASLEAWMPAFASTSEVLNEKPDYVRFWLTPNRYGYICCRQSAWGLPMPTNTSDLIRTPFISRKVSPAIAAGARDIGARSRSSIRRRVITIRLLPCSCIFPVIYRRTPQVGTWMGRSRPAAGSAMTVLLGSEATL